MSNTINPNTKLPTLHPGGPGSGPNRFQPIQKAKNTKGTILRILQLYDNYKLLVLFAILLTLASSLISVSVPYFTGRAFDCFSIETGSLTSDLLLNLLAVMLVLHLSNWITNSLSSFILLEVSQKLIHNFRSQFFQKMQKLPLIFYDTHSHGDTMSRLTNDADNISSSITSATTQLLASLLTILTSIVIMAQLNLTMTLTVLIAVPLIYGLTKTIARKSKKYFYGQQAVLGTLNGIVEENIVGIKIVKAFGKQKEVKDKFSTCNSALYENSFKAQVWSGSMMPMMNVINNLIFALVASLGGYLAVSQFISIGTVVSFLAYSKQFGHPLNNIASMFNTIQQALASAERIFETLDEKEETPDAPQAKTIDKPSGNIVFANVSFSYLPGKPVLRDISFKVKAGQKIAIVGETGSGKTTIINLLNRFYDADSGHIYLDGYDIKDIKRADLRHYFSVVLQETSLFSGSIMDNIRYSRAWASDQEVIQAAKVAHADEFINRLPQGYQTQVSGTNDNLSEGQKQLIAISRAVLSQSPILILDEATSSVDTKTEKEIQKALVSLKENRTSFLIAHRLSTIRDCDIILLIKDGKVAESGSHRQLMANKQDYYRMVCAQMGLNLQEVKYEFS